jgi:hypothetical protein
MIAETCVKERGHVLGDESGDGKRERQRREKSSGGKPE